MKKSVYLSPSLQEHNLGVGGYGNERFRMNQVADSVKKVLERHGVTVYRNNPEWDLAKAVEDSNSKKPDIHFSIHSNANEGKSRGCEIFAYAQGGEREKIARAVYEELEPLTPAPDRGVKFWPGLYELRHTNVPAVLVEVSFHDNSEDAAWIIANIDVIGTAISKGILKYFGITYQPYELEDAVKILFHKGIISTSDYWLQNAVAGKQVNGEYAGALIKNMAKKLKGE